MFAMGSVTNLFRNVRPLAARLTRNVSHVRPSYNREPLLRGDNSVLKNRRNKMYIATNQLIDNSVDTAVEKFRQIILEQLQRVEKLMSDTPWTDFKALDTIEIGVCPGDGIGIEISKQAQRILEILLKDATDQGSVHFRLIEGLTIENRAKHHKAIPDDVLHELKACNVILKGPTTTPQKGDQWPNIESANVAMRRELDLFANVRPVHIPQQGIDWSFFRENTEGAYVLGSRGINIGNDVSVDFKVITEPGAERIIRLAFEFAKAKNKTRVTVVTKSNIIKTTDGRFSAKAREISEEYPGITLDEWYIDIMTAKLLDPARRSDFQVLVMPNLYGDILTDEAAQIQGGVGTAGSANIGKNWAMFEAIHGSAPRMVDEGRAQYADPSSMIKASALLLHHIGQVESATRLEKALDICAQFERKVVLTGRPNGATAEAYADYVLEWVTNPELEATWEQYVKGK